MLEGKIVRLRFRKDQPTQPIWVFIGKVIDFTNDWLKGILVFQRDTYPTERRTLRGNAMVTQQWSEDEIKVGNIDEEKCTLVFPRDAIANIRLLPDDFDLDNIQLRLEGRRIEVVVNNGPNAAVGELSGD